MKRSTRLLNPMLMAGNIREGDLQKSRLSEALALSALAAGTPSAVDLRTLRVCVSLARGLADQGYGADELPTINRAADVLRSCKPIEPVADVAAMRELVGLLDAMRGVCGGAAYCRALLRTQRELG